MKFKAHPTIYNGVNFRSRLEARWAAFFDLCKWEWSYEPFDLDGWTPDFSLKHFLEDRDASRLIEVKPIDWSTRGAINEIMDRDDLKKAWTHVSQSAPVLVLGIGPDIRGKDAMLGAWLEERNDGARDRSELYAPGGGSDCLRLWRKAGGVVQWLPRAR